MGLSPDEDVEGEGVGEVVGLIDLLDGNEDVEDDEIGLVPE